MSKRIEIRNLGGLTVRWRDGWTITSLAAEKHVSHAVMSDRLHEAVEELGRRRILLFLSGAEDEMDFQQIRRAVGEKRLNELRVLDRLKFNGLISERHVGNPPPPYTGRVVYRLTAAGWDEVGLLKAQQVSDYGEASDTVICRGAISGDPVADSLYFFWSSERQQAARKAVYDARLDWCISSMDKWEFRAFRCPKDKQPGMAGFCPEHAAQFNVECSLDLPPLGSASPEHRQEPHLRLVKENREGRDEAKRLPGEEA